MDRAMMFPLNWYQKQNIWLEKRRLRYRRKRLARKARAQTVDPVLNTVTGSDNLGEEPVEDNEQPPTGYDDWEMDKYRRMCDTDRSWNLKKRFMEMHKSNIPEVQLVALAEAFYNVEFMHCSYSPVLMSQVQQLGSSVLAEHRQNGSELASRPTLVSATRAANDWINKLPYIERCREERETLVKALSPVVPIRSVADVWQNLVLVNCSLSDTIAAFETLNCGSISNEIVPLDGNVYEARIHLGSILLARADGNYEGATLKCSTDFVRCLHNRCFKVNEKRYPFPGYYNVERLVVESECRNTELTDNNVGYRMLKKLGWSGGPLGKNRDGIVQPVELQLKYGRCGLGVQTKKPSATKSELDVNFYRELMKAFVRRQPHYDLVFSPAFTKSERLLLSNIAQKMGLKFKVLLTDNNQCHQFVLRKCFQSAHQILVKVLVERDPSYIRHYDVKPPLEPINKLPNLRC